MSCNDISSFLILGGRITGFAKYDGLIVPMTGAILFSNISGSSISPCKEIKHVSICHIVFGYGIILLFSTFWSSSNVCSFKKDLKFTTFRRMNGPSSSGIQRETPTVLDPTYRAFPICGPTEWVSSLLNLKKKDASSFET